MPAGFFVRLPGGGLPRWKGDCLFKAELAGIDRVKAVEAVVFY